MSLDLPVLQFPSHGTCTRCNLHSQSPGVPRHVGIPTVSLPSPPSSAADLPPILVLGQNPGRNEDEQNRPFVGKSGEYVHEVYFKGIHLSDRARIFITNVVRCHTVGNAPPKARHLKACAPHTIADLAAIRAAVSGGPVIVLCLGAVAVTACMKHLFRDPPKTTSLASAFRLNGQTVPAIDGGDLVFFATYHPAALMRTNNLIHAIDGHLQMLAAHLDGRIPQVSTPHIIAPCNPEDLPEQP